MRGMGGAFDVGGAETGGMIGNGNGGIKGIRVGGVPLEVGGAAGEINCSGCGMANGIEELVAIPEIDEELVVGVVGVVAGVVMVVVGTVGLVSAAVVVVGVAFPLPMSPTTLTEVSVAAFFFSSGDPMVFSLFLSSFDFPFLAFALSVECFLTLCSFSLPLK